MSIAQITSIIALLLAFGVPQPTVSRVQSILESAPPQTIFPSVSQITIPSTQTVSPASTGAVPAAGTIPACDVSLTAEVRTLQDNNKSHYLVSHYANSCGINPSGSFRVVNRETPRASGGAVPISQTCSLTVNNTMAFCQQPLDQVSGSVEVDIEDASTTALVH